MTALERLVEGLHPMCMACLRVRWSPIHGAVRMFGVCPGDRQ